MSHLGHNGLHFESSIQVLHKGVLLEGLLSLDHIRAPSVACSCSTPDKPDKSACFCILPVSRDKTEFLVIADKAVMRQQS